MKKGEISWTDDVFQLAAKMWRAGKSGSEIGAKIGKPRSAVIGMMARKGVKTPTKPRRSGYATTRNPEPLRIASEPKLRGPSRYFLIGKGSPSSDRKPPSLPAVIVFPSAPPSLDVTFVDLEDGMCKWPVGAGHRHFCGHATGVGHTYCPHHEQAKTARGMAAIKAAAIALSRNA
jgi:hypothetical protein